jgi:hypothetical protein
LKGKDDQEQGKKRGNVKKVKEKQEGKLKEK